VFKDEFKERRFEEVARFRGIPRNYLWMQNLLPERLPKGHNKKAVGQTLMIGYQHQTAGFAR